jgi:hypothetical protein
MMPFDGRFAEYYEEIFEPAAKDAGFAPVRSNDVFSHTRNVIADTRNLVEAASICLADLSGKNPNVLYELGLAHGRDKPVVLLARSIDDVPFDLRDRRIIPYDTEATAWSDELRDNVARSLSETFQAELSSTTVGPPERDAGVDVSRSSALSVGSGPGSTFSLAEGDELFRDLLADGVSRVVMEQLMREAGLPRGFIRVRMNALGRPGW